MIPQTPPAIVSPLPSAAPACSNGLPRNREATVTRAVAPDWPAGWTLSNRISLTVEVELDALGHVSSAQVATRTSEIDPPEAQKIFDDLALRAATSATYLPKIRDCEPVAATYLYRITYDPRG